MSSTSHPPYSSEAVGGILDFMEEEDSSQEDGKSKCSVNKYLLGPAETTGHRNVISRP